MTFSIWRFFVDDAGNEGWIKHSDFAGDETELEAQLDALRLDGNTYRAEDTTFYGSQVLGV